MSKERPDNEPAIDPTSMPDIVEADDARNGRDDGSASRTTASDGSTESLIERESPDEMEGGPD